MIELLESSKTFAVSLICCWKIQQQQKLTRSFFFFFQNWIRRCLFVFGSGKFGSTHCHIQGKLQVGMKWFVHPYISHRKKSHKADCNFDSIICYLTDRFWVARASWLVRSYLDRAVRVRTLAGDIVLSSWARHLTRVVPLSNQVYKWVSGLQKPG